MCIRDRENAKDLVEIADTIKKNLEIVPVSRMEEVIKHALVRQPQAITWEGDLSAAKAKPTDDEAATMVAH